MEESDVINTVEGMSTLERLNVYCRYVLRVLHTNIDYWGKETTPPKSFDAFCHPSNIIRRQVGDRWQQQGFAAKEWTVFNQGSIYHWLHVGL